MDFYDPILISNTIYFENSENRLDGNNNSSKKLKKYLKTTHLYLTAYSKYAMKYA